MAKIAFQQTSRVNTVADYTIFLREYPNSSYESKARHRLEKLEFEQAVQMNSYSGYRQYVITYPHSSYTAAARIKMQELVRKDWVPAIRNAKTAIAEVNYSGVLASDMGTSDLLMGWLECMGLQLVKGDTQKADVTLCLTMKGRALGGSYNGGYRYTGGVLQGTIEFKAGANTMFKESFAKSEAPPQFIMLRNENEYKTPSDSVCRDLLYQSDFVPKVTSVMKKAIGNSNLYCIVQNANETGQPSEFGYNGKSINTIIRDESNRVLAQ